MATMEELYRRYLLTQPGLLEDYPTSQNRYRQLMSQMRPATGSTGAMGTYSGTGLLPVSATPPRAFISTPTIPTTASTTKTTGGPIQINPGGKSDFGSTDFLANETESARNDRMRGVDDFLTNVVKAVVPGMGILSAAQAAAVRANNVKAGLTVAQEAEDIARQANNVLAGLTVAQDAEAAAIEANNVQAGLTVAQEAEQQALQEALAQLALQQAPMYSAQEAQAQAEANEAAGLAAAADAEASSSEAAAAAGNEAAGLAAAADAEAAAAEAAAAAGDYGTGDTAGFGGDIGNGSDGWAKGGKVTKNRLKGPNPRGPDEGYGALLGGEFVIQKSSVKKYGEGLLGMINDGKIPVQKMKSLLG